MATSLSEQQFRCIICQDVFTDPVSIPCGHNFCLKCIQRYWESRASSDCPLCKEVFLRRPALRVNTAFKDVAEHFKRASERRSARQPVPAKRTLSKPAAVPCDLCQDNTTPAAKSCLACQASYCQSHLMPHLRDPAMASHRLAPPTAAVSARLCRSHKKNLNLFCKTDKTPVCSECRETEHKDHQVVNMDSESRSVKTRMRRTQADVQQMIQMRTRKKEEIKNSVEMSKVTRDRELQATARAFDMLTAALETNQAELIEQIERRQEEVEKKGEELLERLENEITELRGKQSELQRLETSQQPLNLLQSFASLSNGLSSGGWEEVKVQPSSYIGTIRSSFSKLLKVCQDLEKELSAEEFHKITTYAVDVTLDANSASCWLLLSPDRKQVSLSVQPKRLPDDPRRFDSCVSVLGEQSYTSGRSYWVVQVGDKTDWDVGVARSSVTRKGSITVRPDAGYWAICRRKGDGLSACAGPAVALRLQAAPQKVGVFLDYEGGAVSFYDAEAKRHIYTYSGCSFGEPLHPYLNPCLHDNGRNTAPLVICPADLRLYEEAVVL